MQTALQSVGKGMNHSARDVADVDSTLSTRGLMQRKLYLMKKMLKNEREANKVIQQRIGQMGRELHENNFTMK